MQPAPELIVPSSLWQALLGELHRRTDERQESGAFLLGQSTEISRKVEQVVYYDDLDPHACRAGGRGNSCSELRAALGHVPVERSDGRR